MNKSNHGMIASRKNTPVNIRAEAKEEAFKQVNRIASTMEHMKVSPAEVAKVPLPTCCPASTMWQKDRFS